MSDLDQLYRDWTKTPRARRLRALRLLNLGHLVAEELQSDLPGVVEAAVHDGAEPELKDARRTLAIWQRYVDALETAAKPGPRSIT